MELRGRILDSPLRHTGHTFRRHVAKRLPSHPEELPLNQISILQLLEGGPLRQLEDSDEINETELSGSSADLFAEALVRRRKCPDEGWVSRAQQVSGTRTYCPAHEVARQRKPKWWLAGEPLTVRFDPDNQVYDGGSRNLP